MSSHRCRRCPKGAVAWRITVVLVQPWVVKRVNGAGVYGRPVPRVKQQTKYTVFLVNAGPTLAPWAFIIRKKSLQRSFTPTKCLEIQTQCVFYETGADHNLTFVFWFEIVTSFLVRARKLSPAEQSSVGLGSLKGANRPRGPRWKRRRAAPQLPFGRGMLSEGESNSRKTGLKNQSRNVLKPAASSFPSLVDQGCLELRPSL